MTGLKPLETLAVGDWVVLDSVILSRRISAPWRVTAISKSRVYLERYKRSPGSDDLETVDERHVQRKSVLFAFADEATALEAFEFARKDSDEYEAAVRALQKEHRARFDAFMAQLPAIKPSTP